MDIVAEGEGFPYKHGRVKRGKVKRESEGVIVPEGKDSITLPSP